MSRRHECAPRWKPRPSARTALAVALCAAIAVSGCGPAGRSHGGTIPGSLNAPDDVTDENYGRVRRMFFRLPRGGPERDRLRTRIVEYLAHETAAVIDSEEYNEVVEQFRKISSLYSPAEFERNQLPDALKEPAEFMVERASERGNEAHAMSALLVLDKLHPDQDRYRQEYERVADWGQEARKHVGNAVARYTGLIEVWQEHARLTPTPEVLRRVASFHIDRRNALVRAIQSGDGLQLRRKRSVRSLTAPHRLLQRAPFDVAAVYLQHGNIAAAISHLEAMGDAEGVQTELLRVLKDARNPGTSEDATYELAEAYREARPKVALGLCRLGLRESPEDPRFPTCLARVAYAEEQYADATAWYAEAIELAPNERRLYDEALQKLNDLIKEGLFEADPSGAREAARHAEQILKERLERWPGSEPPVAPEQLHLLVGRLEMNAGNPDAAREWFERSLDADDNAEALMQLGLLEERTGRARRAIELYSRALESTPPENQRSIMRRAEILEHLGDAHREASENGRAIELYREALDLWADGAPELRGPPRALVQVRRGVLLDRLDRHDEAVVSFREAMAAAPHMREAYAGILSHLVIAEPADPQLAHEVFRAAQRHLTLEPQWKVYFALWVMAIRGRAGEEERFEDVQALLEKLSDSRAWWGRLAKFGTGKLPYEQLLSEASDLGQQTEAHFYEGTRRLARGDSSRAQKLFQRVLDTEMVNFYEFTMAQELLASGHGER